MGWVSAIIGCLLIGFVAFILLSWIFSIIYTITSNLLDVKTVKELSQFVINLDSLIKREFTRKALM